MTKCWASSWFRKARGPCVTVRTRLSSCWQSLRVMASTLWGHRVGGGRVPSRPCLPRRWEPEGRGGALTSRPGRWSPGWPPRGCRCLTDCPSPRPCSGRSPGKNCESRGCCPAHPSPRRPARAGVSRLEEMVRPRASEWPHTRLPGTPDRKGGRPPGFSSRNGRMRRPWQSGMHPHTVQSADGGMDMPGPGPRSGTCSHPRHHRRCGAAGLGRGITPAQQLSGLRPLVTQ